MDRTKIYISGCGPVGRAPGLGPGCREFESRHSDQKCGNGYKPFPHFSFDGETRTIQCDRPVDCHLSPARRGQLLTLCPKGITAASLATRTHISSFQQNWRCDIYLISSEYQVSPLHLLPAMQRFKLHHFVLQSQSSFA